MTGQGKADSAVRVRSATLDDLPALTDIYNHYIVETPVTFDLAPLEPGDRREWFDAHRGSPRYQLLVADAGGVIAGYATTSRWRPKAAYERTVESTVYCRHGHAGRGIGRCLYTALFEALAGTDVHRVVAGVTLPNPASIALHERFGFTSVGVFREVGYKFGRYWDVGWFERPMGRG